MIINHLESQPASGGAGGSVSSSGCRTLALSHIMSTSQHLENDELDLFSVLCVKRQGRAVPLPGMCVRDVLAPG